MSVVIRSCSNDNDNGIKICRAYTYIHRYIHSPHTDDWQCDQCRWVNNAKKTTHEEPVTKTTNVIVDTPNGPCHEFTKHSYKLIP